jgi:hypothetical protein
VTGPAGTIVRGGKWALCAQNPPLAMLDLSVRTVESHVAAVLRKLHLANRHQLAHWAAQRRLTG